MKYIISVSSVCRLLPKDSHTPVHCRPTESGALTAAERPTQSTAGTEELFWRWNFPYLPADVATESLFTFMQAQMGTSKPKAQWCVCQNKYIWIKADDSLLKHLIAARNDLRMATFKNHIYSADPFCVILIFLYTHNYIIITRHNYFHRHAHVISICCLRVCDTFATLCTPTPWTECQLQKDDSQSRAEVHKWALFYTNTLNIIKRMCHPVLFP